MVRFDVAGNVIGPQGHTHDGDYLTMSEAVLEAKSTPLDAAGSTQVDRAGSVQSDLTCSLQVAPAFGDDREVAATDADMGGDATCVDKVYEVDNSRVQTIKSDYRSPCTTKRRRVSSATETIFFNDGDCRRRDRCDLSFSESIGSVPFVPPVSPNLFGGCTRVMNHRFCCTSRRPRSKPLKRR